MCQMTFPLLITHGPHYTREMLLLSGAPLSPPTPPPSALSKGNGNQLKSFPCVRLCESLLKVCQWVDRYLECIVESGDKNSSHTVLNDCQSSIKPIQGQMSLRATSNRKRGEKALSPADCILTADDGHYPQKLQCFGSFKAGHIFHFPLFFSFWLKGCLWEPKSLLGGGIRLLDWMRGISPSSVHKRRELIQMQRLACLPAKERCGFKRAIHGVD